MSAHKPAAKGAAVKVRAVKAAAVKAEVSRGGNPGKSATRSATKAAAKRAATPAATPPAAATPARAEAAPAAGAAAAGDASATALALARDIDRAVNEGRADVLSEAALQALMAAACRTYSAQVEAGGNFLPLAERCRVTSTDVMVTASGLLKATNLAVFELGMWQSWTGR